MGAAIELAPVRFYPDLGRCVYKVHADLSGHFIGTIVKPKKEVGKRGSASDSLEILQARDEVRQVMMKGFHQKQALKAVRAKLLEEMEETITQEQHQEMDAIVEEAVRKEYSALYLRRKRFLRKALMYKWTHFVTFTYDPAKFESDEDFRKALNITLMNLANRKGWKCAGVWERGEQGERLHFHALAYIPKDGMEGEVVERYDFSTKMKQRIKTYSNTYFLERFGRNDFEPIDENRLKDAVNYVTKYLAKSGEKIRYSRGIPSEILLDLNNDDMYLDYDAGDRIMSLLVDGRISWERDIAVFNTRKEKAMRRLVTVRDGRSIPPPMAPRESA